MKLPLPPAHPSFGSRPTDLEAVAATLGYSRGEGRHGGLALQNFFILILLCATLSTFPTCYPHNMHTYPQIEVERRWIIYKIFTLLPFYL